MRTRLLALTLIGVLHATTAAAQAPVVEYYHLDAAGSVRLVTDANGAEVRRHDYLSFGEEWNPQSVPGDTRRFTGKERDAETALDYFGARYYRSVQGRFTTVDPAYVLENNLVDPQQWNRYAYARNNPLRFTDPDGRIIDTILDIGSVAYDVFDIGRSWWRGESVTKTQLAALGADVAGAAIPFATGGGIAVRAAVKAEQLATAAKFADELVLDTNAVISHGKAVVQSGQKAVKSVVTEVELANLARRGRIKIPHAAAQIPSVPLPGVNTRINVRAGLKPGKRGNFADGIIGATALERGSTLMTNDAALAKSVESLGGRVIKP